MAQRVVTPKRFGLKYDPPQVVLEYLEEGSGKLFHRVMGLSKLKPDTDPLKVALKLKEKNEDYLSDDKVSIEQLVSLISKLQQRRKGQDGPPPRGSTEEATTAESTFNRLPTSSLGRTRSESSSVVNPGASQDLDPPAVVPPLTSSNLRALNDRSKDRTKEFLNDLPPLEQLPPLPGSDGEGKFGEGAAAASRGQHTAKSPHSRSKSRDKSSPQHQSPGGRERTTTTGAGGGANPVSAASSGSKQNVASRNNSRDIGLSPTAGGGGDPSTPTAGGGQRGGIGGSLPANHSKTSAVSKTSGGALGLDGYDYDSYDLNKLTKEEVAKHKAAMDVGFEANRVKPGDPKFVYDLRKEFRDSPTLDNDWDDTESVDLPRAGS
eukprot:CAMPEP_0179006370 /NCGR_PEP_ID=MMETSP0795-20121207/14506_1 /TAXON_ID=88552 /ORGANISM="Amoebophrya sp., Strain Ameob2" /LENGTH=376 /DNA_ID=CAMNT_0020701103 /DNA_START=1487 /DNA_END=2617 /DNA_ORIENTATION=-